MLIHFRHIFQIKLSTVFPVICIETKQHHKRQPSGLYIYCFITLFIHPSYTVICQSRSFYEAHPRRHTFMFMFQYSPLKYSHNAAEQFCLFCLFAHHHRSAKRLPLVVVVLDKSVVGSYMMESQSIACILIPLKPRTSANMQTGNIPGIIIHS